MTSTTTMLDLSNPFPGLRCFLSEEDYLFFGRHEQIEDLLRRLRTNRLVAVVGTSGSGKSSLVRAGLLPAVLGGGMAQAGSAWEIAVMRPGGSPMAHLARTLCEAGLYDADAEDALFHLQATLSRSRNGLIEAVRQSKAAADSKLLLVVDQFEELFRFNRASATSQEEAIGFVNLLMHATQQAEQNVYVVLTMRSDFLGECSQFLGLAEAVNDGEFLIPRMTRDQIQAAIEGPIRVRGTEIAPRLLFRLLNDVQDNQDQLPVLQHALMRTWDLWKRSQGNGVVPLDLEHYEATGGMHAALSRHADEIFDAFPSDAHRTAAAHIFKALTERGPDGRGIRRPTRLGQLVAIAAVAEPIVHQVIEAYRVPGVTFLMPPVSSALEDHSVIDISHESLMRVWSRLRGWVEEEAQSARIYRRLHETAGLHAEKRAGLYHDPDLQIARSWREASGPNSAWAGQYGGGFDEAMEFLDTSREAAEYEDKEREAARQRELKRAQQYAETQAKVARQFKRFAGGLAVGLCLAVALTIWAFKLRQEAKRQEAAANEQRHEAELSRQAESSQRQRAEMEKNRADVTLADMYTSRGLLAGERLSAEATLWFTAAADQSVTAQDSRRQELNQLRARNWMRQATLPVATMRGNPSQLVFQPRGDILLLRFGETEVVFWSWKDGKRLLWAEMLTGVSSAQFSPDGASVALGFPTETQIRKVSNGEFIARIPHRGQLAFSPDGHFLAIASHIARVWDIREQAFLPAVWNHPQVVTDLVFNRKGDRLVTTCHDKRVRVFAVDSSQDRKDPLYAPIAHTVASSPALLDEDRILVTVSGDSELTRWDMATGKPASTPIRTKPRYPPDVVASPDGHWFASGGNSGPELYAADAKSPPVHLGHTNRVTKFVFSPDNTTLLSVSWDQTARLWSLPSGRPLGQPLRHMTIVEGCAWSHDSSYLVTSQNDGLIRVWQRPVDDLVIAQESGWGLGSRPRVSLDGRLAVAGFWHEAPYGPRNQNVSRLRVIATANGKNAGPHISLPGVLVDSCVCGDNLAAAAVWSRDKKGHLGVWDVATAVARFEPILLPGEPISIAARPGSGQLAVICATGDLLIIDDKTGKCVHELRHDGWTATPAGRFVQVRYTPDGKTLVSLGGTSPATVNVRDADTGQLRFAPLRSTVDGSNFHSYALSDDSRHLATMALVKNNVQVWDLATGRTLSEPLPHPGDFWGIFSVRFSPDGRYLLTSHKDGQLRYWDWQAGKLACPPMVHDDEVMDAAITPDGRFAISALRGRPEIQAWELTTGRCVSPPVRLGFREGTSALTLAITPDGRRALVHFAFVDLAVVDLEALLSPSNISTANLAILAELATAQRIELGDLSGLTTDQWQQRWDLLRESNPHLWRSFFSEPRPDVQARKQVAQAWVYFTQKKFVLASRVWAAAMESDPKLGDDRQTQLRYNAACAATLAAAGQGQDEPPLDDAEKAKLRGQALDWLKAELTVWDKLLASGPPQNRAFIVQTLSHWQKDADLAGIRDAAALATLPVDEQKAFTQLWADVAALLKKAEEKPK